MECMGAACAKIKILIFKGDDNVHSNLTISPSKNRSLSGKTHFFFTKHGFDVFEQAGMFLNTAAQTFFRNRFFCINVITSLLKLKWSIMKFFV